MTETRTQPEPLTRAEDACDAEAERLYVAAKKYVAAFEKNGFYGFLDVEDVIYAQSGLRNALKRTEDAQERYGVLSDGIFRPEETRA